MANKMFTAKNIAKAYKGFKVLDDISFSLNKGELISLMGPSGCGKTTILNILAGLIKADGGKFEIQEDLKLAYVFQDIRLLPWKTVEENLKFVQENYLEKKRAEGIRNELFHKVGLEGFEKKYPFQLSGGMKQRVELIRALSIQPNILLMDEPFKSVDYQLKLKIRDIIKEFIRKDKKGLLLITHDPKEAVLLSDKIYILSKRPTSIEKILEINTPRDERDTRDDTVHNHIKEIIEYFREL